VLQHELLLSISKFSSRKAGCASLLHTWLHNTPLNGREKRSPFGRCPYGGHAENTPMLGTAAAAQEERQRNEI